MKSIKFKKLELINSYPWESSVDIKLFNVLKRIRKLKCRNNFKYLFFKIPDDLYQDTSEIIISIYSSKNSSILILNGYRNKNTHELKKGTNKIRIPIDSFEIGENSFSYKGILKISKLTFLKRKQPRRVNKIPEISLFLNKNKKPLDAAIQFLVRSVIERPTTSPFCGNCYCIYDYDNNCYRMSYWLWNNAPIVSALLSLAKQTNNKERKSIYESIAFKIGDVLMKHQIIEEKKEHCGAITSRYRYFGASHKSFECLLGPNDTSFIVKWALLPLYDYTKNRKYLLRSKLALEWVKKIVGENAIVSSHFYLEREIWENRTFIDAAFTPEGFVAFNKNKLKNRDYIKTADIFMSSFINKFKMKSGFYRQNIIHLNNKVSENIFTRGQAWVLEGLISTYEGTKNKYYLHEAINLTNLLVNEQNPNGSWSYLLGKKNPNKKIKKVTGVCEKTTAILCYLMIHLYNIHNDERFLSAAKSAMLWCESNMELNSASQGYGGICSRSLNSGIVGLPYLKVATGYANAFYILAVLYYEKVIK